MKSLNKILGLAFVCLLVITPLAGLVGGAVPGETSPPEPSAVYTVNSDRTWGDYYYNFTDGITVTGCTLTISPNGTFTKINFGTGGLGDFKIEDDAKLILITDNQHKIYMGGNDSANLCNQFLCYGTIETQYSGGNDTLTVMIGINEAGEKTSDNHFIICPQKDIKLEKPVYVNNVSRIFGFYPELIDDMELDNIKDKIGIDLKNSNEVNHMFLGGKSTGTTLHASYIGNFFFNIKGIKKWYLIHPKYSNILLPTLSRTGLFAVSKVDIFHKNDLTEKVPRYEFELNEGDLLFNPPWWWHAVKNQTDYTIGFHTAVQIATDALDRLRSTAESHHRVMLLEVMGRRTGWIAAYAGMANGAEAILIPEIPLDEEKLNELCQMLEERKRRGTYFSLIVVAEGTELEGKPVLRRGFTLDKRGKIWRLEGFGGVGQVIGGIIEERTGLEVRVSSLDYIQRGGTPVAVDRSLATAFGVKAAELICARKYGVMTALSGNRVVAVPLHKVANGVKTVPLSVYRVAEMFFG